MTEARVSVSMEKSQTRPESPSGTDRFHSSHDQVVHPQSIVTLIPTKFIAVADGFERKEHSWYKFISSQIPTDFTIQIQEVSFSVHKYPFVSKCGYLSRLELQPSKSDFSSDIKLENFPGGSETFEIILKFCYGLPIDLNPQNVAPLRCASEYLEMTEELEDGNLISKTEAFLTFVVFSSWKDTITVLRACETLSPWAENLQIVRRCCDSIAWKASRDTITEDSVNEEGWWSDEVTTLRIDHFMRIITTLRAKGTRPEIIGKCIMHYAERWLPGMDVEMEGLRGYGHVKKDLQFSILSKRKEDVGIGHSKEQKAIIESLVSLLPPQHEAVSCKFLLKMLRAAMMCSASPALISELEKRAGMMLEHANVNDLLFPRYKIADQGKLSNNDWISSPEECTMHDIDVLQRIVEYFLMHEQQQQHKTGKSNVSKLLDNCLAEVAQDPNLSVTKFQVLAELLPENARICDDGLYRAIDIYLKTHPSLPEHERRRLCKTMNCEKLSLDACTHAAQNDRLPLRTIVQVLFSEQVKMRAAMQEKEAAPSGNNSEQEGNHSSTDMEIKTLKAELESVKMKMIELQNDYVELLQDYEKLSNKNKHTSGWSIGWRRIKKSFHTKPDKDETGGEEQQRSNPSRIHFRQRQSIS
ncbi:BTB/POZ domain-containing protein DOT3 isoform X3 [Ziziphus jujuba]|uniref:BTB/POZ domain-containing protein DOT3 isoform X3 n=1 Tax=Ziziphus jujuba TaxID=326968 RepID=A0ABM3ITD7_ZIZJJ|nr:BTB/POZ domain-containing protein DOT3 isoform X3 [Ziziphus jujuba]